MNKPNTHPHLGFTFTDEEEERMQRAIASAIAFMKHYGKGKPIGQMVNLRRYIQAADNYEEL